LAIFGRPVKARAPFTAIITASLPELVKRTRSADGRRSHSSAASSTSSGVGNGNDEPCAIRRLAASTMAGWAWPWMRAV
jgi:hypothetical protein